MDKMSVWSILFASYPEEILIVLITLSAAGYIDVLNFRNKENFIKLFLSSSLMVVVSIVCRTILPSITISFMIQVVLYFLIIVSVYRYRFLACILGFVLSIAIYITSEAVLISPIMQLFNISLQDLYNSDFLRIMLSLPDRISQIVTVVIICKLRNINLKFVRLKKSEWIHIILFSLMIVSSMVSIETGIRNISKDYGTILNLVLNISIAVIFSSSLIYNIFSLRKNMYLKENIHDIELHHIKQLLEEGKTDYTIKLIDLTLQEKGYYTK